MIKEMIVSLLHVRPVEVLASLPKLSGLPLRLPNLELAVWMVERVGGRNRQR